MHPPFMVPYMRNIVPYHFLEMVRKQHDFSEMIDRRIDRFLHNPHSRGVLAKNMGITYKSVKDAAYSYKAASRKYFYERDVRHQYPHPEYSEKVCTKGKEYMAPNISMLMTIRNVLMNRIPIILSSVLPRHAPALKQFALDYRLSYPDVQYLIGTYTWLANSSGFLYTMPYEITPHKLALLSSLRCTSGDFMGMMNTRICDSNVVRSGRTVDLFMRLTLAPYEHHYLMFNPTNHMPLEDMYDYLPVRGRGGSKTGNDPYYKFDELASYRETLYPLYESMIVGDYTFPEGRHRSLYELATDPDWYSALERDDITVVDIAHLLGVSVPIVMQVFCMFLLDIRTKALYSRNPFVTEYQHSIDAYYQRITRSSNKVSHRNILFSEMIRLHEYVKPMYPFLELYVAKVGALELEILDRIGYNGSFDPDTELYLEKKLFPNTGFARIFRDK